MNGERGILCSNGLFNRWGINISRNFPEIEFPKTYSVLDGEIVCDTFGHLQSRAKVQNPLKINVLRERYPAKFVVFDILLLNGKDTTDLPLIQRKKLLDGVGLPKNCELIEHTTDLENLYNVISSASGEGIMLKKRDSKYSEGVRSNNWLKLKFYKEIDVQILGYTSETREISALITDRGKVNMALPQDVYEHWVQKLKDKTIEVRNGNHWVEENLFYAKVKFLEITEEGKMRFPRLREIYADDIYASLPTGAD